MVDLHSHILPGIDDGAQDLSESLKMARMAVKQGIHAICATPHHMNNQFTNPKDQIIKNVKILNDALIQEKIDLTVIPGQETRIFGEMVDENELGEILPINHTKYILVEFPSSHVPRYTGRLFFEMQMKGLVPVIVHPERNQQIIEQPDILYQLVKKGALTQITAASLSGDFGKKIRGFTFQLIESNLTHFIASDAHNTSSRSFKMQEGFDVIQEKYGTDLVYFFEDNAALLIEGKHVYKEEPEPIKRKKFFKIF